MNLRRVGRRPTPHPRPDRHPPGRSPPRPPACQHPLSVTHPPQHPCTQHPPAWTASKRHPPSRHPLRGCPVPHACPPPCPPHACFPLAVGVAAPPGAEEGGGVEAAVGAALHGAAGGSRAPTPRAKPAQNPRRLCPRSAGGPGFEGGGSAPGAAPWGGRGEEGVGKTRTNTHTRTHSPPPPPRPRVKVGPVGTVSAGASKEPCAVCRQP